MTGRPAYRGASLMLFSTDPMYLAVARAILILSCGRFQKLLEFEMSSGLKRLLILNAPQASFAKLSTELICKLLRSDDISLRQSISLKCLAVFEKDRLKNILDHYVRGDGTHYYNVVHWFDFGISMPSQIVVPSLKRAL